MPTPLQRRSGRLHVPNKFARRGAVDRTHPDPAARRKSPPTSQFGVPTAILAASVTLGPLSAPVRAECAAGCRLHPKGQLGTRPWPRCGAHCPHDLQATPGGLATAGAAAASFTEV